MKCKIVFTFLFLLLCISNYGYADINSVTNDMFGLKMIVIAPFPDVLDDGVQMDTVRYGSKVSLKIEYKNLTEVTQREFEISAFFPNRFESYTKLISWSQPPDYVDHPDSSIQATWKLDKLAPSDSGTIEFTLLVNRAPKDTIYLSYEAIARAKWTPVSQISHTNIYIPGGEGIAPYPNLWINKIDNADDVFPKDTIKYTIRYGNIGEVGSIPAESVAIMDTLPPHFTFLDGRYPTYIDSLSDGRTLLIWELQNIVPYSFIDSISFRVRVDLIADRDSLVFNGGLITSSIDEVSLINNRDREPVLIKPKINLAIEHEGLNQYNLNRDESRDFNLRCKNLSSLDLDNIQVIVKIDDGLAGFNIYSFHDIGGGKIESGGTLIYWNIPNLASQDSTILTFTMIMNKVEKFENYSINFRAEIDTTVILADGIHTDIDTSDNHDEWVVKVDATPDLSIKIAPDKDLAMANETRRFILTCSNASIGTLDNIGVRVYIDDGVIGSNIYTLSTNVSQNNGHTNADTTFIEWFIPALSKDDTRELSFDLVFNKIEKPYRDYPDFNVIATIDSVETDSTELVDNVRTCEVFVDGTPNLSIKIKENNDKTSADPNSTLNFTLTCKNLSSPALDSINVRAEIKGNTIFTILQEDGKLIGDKLVKWKIPPLLFDHHLEKNFDLTFDKIFKSDNYGIKILAAIDTLETNQEEFADNTDSWDVSVNATPEVKLGPITISPSNPILRNIVEYNIPYANEGNFPAKNAIMTIERPDFTYTLYYIYNDSTNTFEDLTITKFEIPLGDLAPDFRESIVVGLRIYAYKELPINASRPLPLKFKASIAYDGGEVSASRFDEVPYDPTIADLILDKNIVEPDKLPLKITFKSSDFGNVDIKIYNLAGEFIKTIYIGPVEKGDTYVYNWDGLNERGNTVSSGVYFIYAVSKFYNGYKKVVIVK